MGLVVFLLVMAWNSAWRMKAMIAVAVFAPLGFLALPEQLQNRFETIVNPAAGPSNAQTSAQGRVEGFEIGMQLWQNNLATGVGPGAWIVASGRKLQAHNLYGQLAGELGTLGVVAFSGFLIAFAATIRRIRRAYRQHPEWEPDFLFHLSGGLGLGIALLMLGGLAGHNLYRPQWILFAAFLSIIRSRVAERETESSTAWNYEANATEEWEEQGEGVPA